MIGPVARDLDRARVVAADPDRLTADAIFVPITLHCPVDSTFWQYPAGWMNVSGSVSIGSAVTGS